VSDLTPPENPDDIDLEWESPNPAGPAEDADVDRQWASLEPAAPAEPVGRDGKPKRKLDWLFFVLGFATPIAYGVLIALPPLADQSGVLAIGGYTAFLVASLVMWIAGRQMERNRLRSYGLGGLLLYVFVALGALLLFGSCLILYRG
jgi:hypothetical protein